MASFNERTQREAKEALCPDPNEFPGIDWFCLGVYIVTGAWAITILFGCIALAQMLLSFWH